MLNYVITSFHDALDAIIQAFLWPGEMLVSAIVFYSPGAAAWLTIDEAGPSTSMTFVFSLIVWFLVIVVIVKIGKFLRNVLRTAEAFIRTGWFRASLFFRGMKTRLMLKFRPFLFRLWGKSGDAIGTGTVEMDDLDLAVLRSASERGPGLAVSAPELAEQFRLRPAQVQRSLKKLSAHKMLDYVIGSTDGYDNYRLTDSGAAYVAILQRTAAKA